MRRPLPTRVSRSRLPYALFTACLLVIVGCAGSESQKPQDGQTTDAGVDPGAQLQATSLRASRDRPDAVELVWRGPALPPDELQVLRDGIPVAALPGDAQFYLDTTAEAGALGEVTVQASQGTRADGVELIWTSAAQSGGRVHEYVLVARYGTRWERPSDTATGQRAPPVLLGYEVCREPCVAWVFVVGAEHYVDSEAPLAQLAPTTSSAQALIVPEAAVRLVAGDTSVTPRVVHYRVRAAGDIETGPASLPASGFRASGPLHHQWQRRPADSDAPFASLEGVTGISWVDARATLDAALEYRALIFADGAEPVISAPVTVHTEPPVERIARSEDNGCTILRGGMLRCWGSGPLPDLARTASAQGAYREIALGGHYAEHLCALTAVAGELRCWSGSLDSQAVFTPSLLIDALGPFVSLSAGPSEVCAVEEADGHVRCFAFAGSATVFDADAYLEVAVATPHACAVRASDHALICQNRSEGSVVPQGTFSRVVANSWSTCVLRESDGHGVCFGAGAELRESSEALTDIVASGYGGCGLTREGSRVHCWGETYEHPVAHTYPPGGYHGLSAGEASPCVILSDGRVRCFEPNDSGPGLPPSHEFARLQEMCAIDVDGELYCPSGSVISALEVSEGAGVSEIQIGSDYACVLSERNEPKCVGAFHGPVPEVALSTMSASHKLLCGVERDTGRLRCWGRSAWGEPKPEPDDQTDYQAAVVGYSHVCGLTHERKLRCFGGGYASYTPPAESDERYTQVVASEYATCGVLQDSGSLRCTGILPAPPQGRFLAVAIAGLELCALRESDGRILCRGPATQLSNGTTRATYSALAASAPVSSQFSEGTVCALRVPDQKRVCWGLGQRASDGNPIVMP